MKKWVPNYYLKYGFLDIGINLKRSFVREQFFIDFGVGIGVSGSTTHINVLDAQGEFYEYSSVFSETNPPSLIHDDTFETKFEGDSFLNKHYYVKTGLYYKVLDNGYFGINMRYHISSTDYHDSLEYYTVPSIFNTNKNENDFILMFSLAYSDYIGS